MDKGSSWIARWSGLPGPVRLSIRPRRPPTLNDVVVVLIVPSQCQAHCPVVLPGAIPVVDVIRGWPLSRRGLVIRVATVAMCASFPVRH